LKLEELEMRYVPRIEPLFGREGWMALGAFALLTLGVLPLLYLLPEPDSALRIRVHHHAGRQDHVTASLPWR
jgi:hypothetical protein